MQGFPVLFHAGAGATLAPRGELASESCNGRTFDGATAVEDTSGRAVKMPLLGKIRDDCGRRQGGAKMMKLKLMSMAAVVAAGLLSIVSAEAQTLRFGHANAPGEVANDMFNELAERVTKRTNG